ncbi:hypothetical protein HNR46_002761 [Haloferula luteola]|uniref:PEP-CTERM protein-sorting domain-containing protein n=1 Tax=Haloferula luteola TaxID=595692 RepID=A0A840V3E3_9BACT|nr:PEP-CTERM sorting domain-containing protein [Haloferula luteola]MBB5352515.1 hypothetical protein [Haloferula luteola]
MKFPKASLLAFGFQALTSPLPAAIIANHTAAINDRFADDPSFAGSLYDFSGVGRTSDGEWATMIGGYYFVSANHFHPSAGETVRFYNSNSPSGSYFEYTVSGGYQVSGTDLWVGYFSVNVDSSITTYNYATASANSVAETGLSGQNLLSIAQSPTSNSAYGGGAMTDMALGVNRLESWFEQDTNTVTIAGVTNTFGSNAGWDQMVLVENLSGDTANAYQTNEMRIETGDSGSPLFATVGSELSLVGIAYSVTNPPGLTGNFIDTAGNYPGDPYEERIASFYTYSGANSSGLSSIISSLPMPVPEPSLAALTALGTATFLRRRRPTRVGHR